MANTPTRRVIAVEEHFVTDHYWSETEKLAVPPGEEPEHAFMLSFPRNGYMRPRLTNVQKRLDLRAHGRVPAVHAQQAGLPLPHPGP